MGAVPIPYGDEGTFATLAAMQRLVYEAAADPYVRAWGVLIVRDLPERAVNAHVDAIRNFLWHRVRFLDDPLGVELVHRPARLLQEIEALGSVTGDCDDVATLGAALGAVVGLASRFTVLSFGSSPGNEFEHVYAELLAGGVWRELDTTRGGPHSPSVRITRRQTFPCLPDW